VGVGLQEASMTQHRMNNTYLLPPMFSPSKFSYNQPEPELCYHPRNMQKKEPAGDLRVIVLRGRKGRIQGSTLTVLKQDPSNLKKLAYSSQIPTSTS
jgi:hypothetical protein